MLEELVDSINIGPTAVQVAGAIVVNRPTNRMLLNAINSNVNDLRMVPFNAGFIHLDEALLSNRGNAERVRLVRLAREKFVDALDNVPDDAMWASLCELYIGACWFALKSRKDAISWVVKSHKHVTRVIVDPYGYGPWALSGWPEAAQDALLTENLSGDLVYKKAVAEKLNRALRQVCEYELGVHRLINALHRRSPPKLRYEARIIESHELDVTLTEKLRYPPFVVRAFKVALS
ncbi:MAG TPA: hypothetical protein VGG83_02170 [Trebonia sp.]|jgi:hypothetical protein